MRVDRPSPLGEQAFGASNASNCFAALLVERCFCAAPSGELGEQALEALNAPNRFAALLVERFFALNRRRCPASKRLRRRAVPR
ncbi:MAG: hypothetical protein IKY61_05285 [Thermoguttaceae bacterium]|nr:hypothetical protein [Thermoguttaceae bacterium]